MLGDEKKKSILDVFEMKLLGMKKKTKIISSSFLQVEIYCLQNILLYIKYSFASLFHDFRLCKIVNQTS
jgi:hypothetical protein